jgi:outer membrane protein, multidrug efflux system
MELDSTSRMPTKTLRAVSLALTLVALCAVAVTGCATAAAGRATPTTTPQMPAAWGHSTPGATPKAENLSRWWERFGDATLTKLVDQAVEQNPDLRTALSRLRQARAQRLLAEAQRMPSVSGSGSGTANHSSSAQSSVTGSGSLGLDASWELDVFGAKGYAIAAARADEAVSEASLQDTRVSLVAEVATNYVDLRGGQARLAIARKNLESQSETLQLTQWRAQAGLVSSLDVEQARTSVEQTKASLPSIEATIAQAQHRLAILCGLEPNALVPMLSSPGDVPALPATLAVGVPADTLRQRPDVKKAEMQIVAETARLAKTNTTRLPSFTLSGSLAASATSGAMTGGTSLVAQLVASAAQTLFDGGRIRQQIEIQSAVQEQAVFSYEGAVLTALEDVENALVSLERYRQQRVAYAAAAEAAANAAILARNRYTAGLTDFQTVLDTERTLLTAEESTVTTQASHTSAAIQLYKALGGGWPVPEQTSAPSAQGDK